MKLSILIPAYNEENSVEAVLRRVAQMDTAALGVAVELELIVVDDCSTDATTGILARLHGGPAETPGGDPRREAARPPTEPLPTRVSEASGGGFSVGGHGPPASSLPAGPPHGSASSVGSPAHPVAAGGDREGTNGTLDGALPGLRVIQHGRNRGKGAAIRTALVAATGDYVIIQDADFEYDPADIPRLLQPIVDGSARVVYGARPLDGAGKRWLLDFGNRALTVITNLLYGTHLHDMETCYKLLPTRLLRDFDLECSHFDMEPEITAKVTRSGYRIHEVPIAYHPRAGGKKLSARKDGLPALQALMRYRTWFPQVPPLGDRSVEASSLGERSRRESLPGAPTSRRP